MSPRRSRFHKSRSFSQHNERETPVASSSAAFSFGSSFQRTVFLLMLPLVVVGRFFASVINTQAIGPTPQENSYKRRIERPEIIVISDDEESEEPIATIMPGQESALPVSGSVHGILQKLEKTMQQTATAISFGWGRFYDLLPFIASSLKDIQRVGGIQLARRCNLKLTCLEELMYRLEELVYSDSHDEAMPLMIDARIQRMHERKARARRISGQEIIVANLYEQQRHLQTKMDAYNNIADSTGIRTVLGERTLKDFELESTGVQSVYKGELEALHALYREDMAADAATTLANAKLQKKEEEKVRVEQAEKLAAVKAKIASFSLLNLI